MELFEHMIIELNTSNKRDWVIKRVKATITSITPRIEEGYIKNEVDLDL